jgi:hypothetical protein
MSHENVSGITSQIANKSKLSKQKFYVIRDDEYIYIKKK